MPHSHKQSLKERLGENNFKKIQPRVTNLQQTKTTLVLSKIRCRMLTQVGSGPGFKPG